jgi:hypothetical protein
VLGWAVACRDMSFKAVSGTMADGLRTMSMADPDAEGN